MEINVGDVVQAQVTKADLKQEAGLKLEQRHGRIYVRKIEGLFKRRGVPVQAGDQILELNGKDVKDYRDLNEMKALIKNELKIFIKFMRVDPDDSQSTDSDDEPEVLEQIGYEEEEEDDEEEERLQLEYHKIRRGDEMKLQDVQAKPELNGKRVKVLQEADKTGRWQVKVKYTGVVMSVAAEKLAQIDDDESSEEEVLCLENEPSKSGDGIEPGTIMKLFKLKAKAKMNGMLVKVLRPSNKAGRWEVEIVDTQQVLSIAQENLRRP